jgi:hypothetical protein
MAGSAAAATDRVRSAAARTAAAGSARLAFGVSAGSPVAGERDWVGEGVVDFTGRRALASQLFMPARMHEDLSERVRDDETAAELPPLWEALGQRREVFYDGANQLLRAGDRWMTFTLDDRDGPRSHEDPLWPLDALFGAGEEVFALEEQPVRDVPTTHYRLTIDLASADALVPAGVIVPEGPYRRLRQLPAEAWLDAAGLARRIAIAKARRSNAAGEPIWMVAEFWDFGVPVTITPPEPDKITAPNEAAWLSALLSGNLSRSPNTGP